MGKTTVSLAAASFWATRGEAVLHVEVTNHSTVGPLLHVPPLEFEPREIAPRLYALRATGQDALREHLLRQIKVKRLYHLFFENRPIRYFFEVAPALRDLMVLGKIVRELERPAAPGPYAHIVVDAPATGHGLFLLRTPNVVKRLSRLGPIFDRAAHIHDVLSSPETTQAHIVTLARPIVVRETVELLEAVERSGLKRGHLFANRMILPGPRYKHRQVRDYAARAPNAIYRLLATRAAAELRELKRLETFSGHPPRVLTELPDPGNLKHLGDWFKEACT